MPDRASHPNFQSIAYAEHAGQITSAEDWGRPQLEEKQLREFRDLLVAALGMLKMILGRCKSNYQHREKIIWKAFLASSKNIPGQWWIRKPYLPPKSFVCGPHLFRQRRVPHWGRVVCGFFSQLNNARTTILGATPGALPGTVEKSSKRFLSQNWGDRRG